MDGLIFDTENLFMEILGIEMAKKGYKLTRENYIKLLGLNVPAVEKGMKEMYGEDYPFKEISQLSREALGKKAREEGLPIKKGIRELLEFLKERDIKTAVASSSPTVFVSEYLKCSGIYDLFDVVMGGDKVIKSKPEPDIFLKACELLDGDIKTSLVLEDSENGIKAALNGGIRVICIPDMKHPCEELCDKLFALAKDGFEVKDIINGQI